MQRTSPLRSWLSGTLRVVTSLALGVFGVALAPQLATAQSVDRSLERSIVAVDINWTGYVEFPSTEGGWVWSDQISVWSGCTGWFASSEGQIVTAGHCVDPEGTGKSTIVTKFLERNDAMHLYDRAMLNWRVVGNTTGGPVARSVYVVQSSRVEDAPLQDSLSAQVMNFRSSSEGDLALLKVSGLSVETPPLEVAADEPEIGTPVTAMGFPIAVSGGTGQTSKVPNVSYKSGTISSRQVNDSGIEYIEVSAELGNGMSGGPGVDESGAVVGVVSWGVADKGGSNFGFLTDTDDLRSFLASNGITPKEASPSESDVAASDVAVSPVADESSSGGVPLSMVIGGGVLFLAIIAGLVVWMLRIGRHQTRSGGPIAPV